jgi:hypothetical protein
MQLRWFHIRGVCIAPGCVYRSSSAKQGMGIPGGHVNRVETYHPFRGLWTKFNLNILLTQAGPSKLCN